LRLRLFGGERGLRVRARCERDGGGRRYAIPILRLEYGLLEKKRKRERRGSGFMAEGSGKRMMVSSQCWWNLRVCLSLAFAATIAITGFLGLRKPVTNGCTMTYMYPTYIPVPAPPNATSNRYALYLYHEGWKKIDYQLELVKLSGVPVLFIPGNGGSYKQVWSLIFFFLSFTSRSRFAH